MDLIVSVNSAINGFVWGPVMMVLLIGTGILMACLHPGGGRGDCR